MSLAHPLWLLLLLLLPLLALAQRWRRGRGTAYAVRFPAVGTVALALAEEGRTRWLRALPVVALLGAIAVIALALARPSVTHRVPINGASLMLVLDQSGSMAAADVKPDRLNAAIVAANTFIDQLPSSARVGALTFSTAPDEIQRPSADHAAARALIENAQAGGGTDTGPALEDALSALDASSAHHPPAAIVLLSDGAANIGVSPVAVAAQAKRDHVAIYTVALGTPGGVLYQGAFNQPVAVPPDPRLMAQIARTSGGRAYDAQTANNLSSIYKTLGQRLSTVKRKRDVTIYALALAAVLLMIAIVASARTAARLP
jgi:Ca-activated chloride channel family protein